MTDDVEIVPFFGGERCKVIEQVVTFVQATKEEAIKLAHAIVGDANVRALVIHKGLTTNPEPVAYMVEALREWKGLTDDEIKEIIGPWGETPIKGCTRRLFDQIEAKLKEKNFG